jgi:hypothetical protein
MSTNKASIYYDIITEYNGKGAKTAATSFGSLDSAGKKLAKTLAGVFSVVAIERFGKASIDAFAKEDAAIKVLSNTLGNLGLAFDTPQINSFITKLAESTGVMKEQLFPAFETLVRYTNDSKKAQDLLNLSLDISAGTGRDASAVALALGKAYGGNTVALGRLGAGLTKAELSSKNFSLVQNRLTALFKGDAAAAADSYQGKINRLKVAFTELKVNVGQGLVDAFSNITGDQGIAGVITAMNEFGLVAGQTLANLSSGIQSSGLATLFGGLIKDFLVGINVLSGHPKSWDQLLLDAQMAKERRNTQDLETYYKNIDKTNAIILANKKQQAALDSKALQAAKDKAALEKANAALKLADSVFDLQKIEIMAALARGQNQADTDRLNLQLLILNATNLTGDALTKAADNATILSEKILMANGLVMLADGSIQNLKQAKNPFAGFDAYVQSVLNGILAIQQALNALKAPSLLSAPGTANNAGGGGGGGAFDPLSGLKTTVADQLATGVLTNAQQYNPLSGLQATTADISAAGAYNPLSGMTVNIMIDPSTLTSVVTTGQQNSTVGGTIINTSRINQAAIG